MEQNGKILKMRRKHEMTHKEIEWCRVFRARYQEMMETFVEDAIRIGGFTPSDASLLTISSTVGAAAMMLRATGASSSALVEVLREAELMEKK